MRFPVKNGAAANISDELLRELNKGYVKEINPFVRNWNRLVADSWRYMKMDTTHYTFLHPRKGYRRVSRKRLGV